MKTINKKTQDRHHLKDKDLDKSLKDLADLRVRIDNWFAKSPKKIKSPTFVGNLLSIDLPELKQSAEPLIIGKSPKVKDSNTCNTPVGRCGMFSPASSPARQKKPQEIGHYSPIGPR